MVSLSIAQHIQRKQWHIILLTSILSLGLAIVIGIGAFSQPVRVDPVLPSIQRFSGFAWYQVVPWAALPCVLFFFVSIMIFPLVKWLKMYVVLPLLIAVAIWTVAVSITNIVFMANVNQVPTPNNPANSYAVCCTPQFFIAVTTCPNYGLLSPQCTPPRTLLDVGVNGDMIFVFIMDCGLVVGMIVASIFTLQLMRLMDAFVEKGDGNFVPQTLAATGTTYYVAKGVNPTTPYYNQATPLSATLHHHVAQTTLLPPAKIK